MRRLALRPVARLSRAALARSFRRGGGATSPEADNRSKPLCHLLAFRDRGGRELAAEALIEAGIEVVPSALAPLGLTVREGLPWTTAPFRDGQLYVQDEASQVAALMPPPVAGERILDCAAAPGGKAFSLLAFEPGVRLVAADVDVERVALMRRNAGRLGRAMPILVADAAGSPRRRPSTGSSSTCRALGRGRCASIPS